MSKNKRKSIKLHLVCVGCLATERSDGCGAYCTECAQAVEAERCLQPNRFTQLMEDIRRNAEDIWPSPDRSDPPYWWKNV